MLFQTPEFLIFFAGLIALLLLLHRDEHKKVLLLLASYIFYMWWNPAFVLLILFSTLLDFLVGRRMALEERPGPRKALLLASLIGNLGMLAYFKYAGFLSEACLYLLRRMGFEVGWTSLHIILPVGISFYTFQTLSYTIDVYRRKLEPTKCPLDFALFVAFFPQLIAGPIVRASEFLPQLQGRIRPRWDRQAFYQVLGGLGKKVLIADNLAHLTDFVFADAGRWPSVVLWFASISFGVQIYCDFSGYSDMAIGLARFLGFRLPRNFDYPYFASNPRDFWRHWHISLSSWLRDYLYIPLGGGRRGPMRTVLNIQITTLLGGLWHGAGWSFLFWGFLHGTGLVAYLIYRKMAGHRADAPSPSRAGLRRLVSIAFLNYWILLTWIPFRIRDWDQMVVALRKFVFFDGDLSLTGLGLGATNAVSSAMLLSVFGALHLASKQQGGIHRKLATMSLGKQMIACFLFGLAAPLALALQ